MTNDELEARLADIDAQLKKLFSFFGPATWTHIKRQADANIKAQGTKAPFSRNQAFGEVYRPKPHEGNQ
jgi:hypothetical protein